MTSIKEIALKAGVSIGTIDRVLHKRGRVSKKTQDRVERIVVRLGYKPNIYARNLSLARAYQFGVLMPKLSQDSGYWRLPANGIDRARQQFEHAKVGVRYFCFDRYSESSFARAFSKASRESLDGLLVAPVLARIAERLIVQNPLHIPYVFFDSTIPRANVLSTIGQDPFQSGLLAAHLMISMQGVDGSVAVVKVIPEDFHINERLRGFESGIKTDRTIQTKTYEADSHGGESAFRSVAQQILRENRNLRGLFVSNAWTHPFAHYFNASESRRRVCIIGYDLVGKNQQYLERGLIDFLISQRPEMQGFEGIQALYRHVVLRDKVKKRITVPLDIITKENVQYYQD
jgi:LacI family transcriptional regulator